MILVRFQMFKRLIKKEIFFMWNQPENYYETGIQNRIFKIPIYDYNKISNNSTTTDEFCSNALTAPPPVMSKKNRYLERTPSRYLILIAVYVSDLAFVRASYQPINSKEFASQIWINLKVVEYSLVVLNEYMRKKNFGKKFRWYNGARDLLACFMEKIKFQL